MHEFDICSGNGVIALMYCKRCGISFVLTRVRRDGDENVHAAWEPVLFQDLNGKEMKLLWKPCHKEETKNAKLHASHLVSIGEEHGD